jgi:hypothetical protein
LRHQRLPDSTIAHVFQKSPRAASYLDFDFAWKALSERDTLGNYLDVFSPWLFPMALLSRCSSSGATLVSPQPDALKGLLEFRSVSRRQQITFESGDATLDEEAYDTITSLSWLGRVHDDVGLVRRLWRSLKPGGTLLLSVPCAKTAAEEYAPPVGDSPTGHGPGGNFLRRLYDARLLNTRIFEVVGQPRRYTVYGEQARVWRDAGIDTGDHDIAASTWRDSMIIGRAWRSYSTLQELPGEGVIAMKLVKSESGRKADAPFSLRLV